MYAKLENGILIAPPKFYNGIINYDLNTDKLTEDGWKEVVYTQPENEPEEDQELTCSYEETENEIRQVWNVRDIPAYILIDRAKAQLTETDYKIIKCSEYQLAGLEAPYDIEEFHQERQALRDKINGLEEG